MKPFQLALLLLAASAAVVSAPEARGAVVELRAGTAAVFGWVVDDADHVCGIRHPGHISNPATVDFRRAMSSTEEMKRLKRDGIDPNSARGQALTNAAKRRVRDAASTVKDNLGHCSVWKSIRHTDGRSVADITDQVISAF